MAWPIAGRALGPVQVGTLLWRRGGTVRATALVKATFAMVHGGFCLPVDPKPISRTEQPWLGVSGGTPELGIEAWPELARPEVVLRGNAIAPGREATRALATRLVVWKTTARIDKTLHVVGPRRDVKHIPAPFTTLPIVWERTTQGVSGSNPVGVKEGAPTNVIDPRDPSRPACFAGRAATWPGRDLPVTDGEEFPPAQVWEWPETIPASAFASAPEDQRLDRIDGDEWIVLEGMHAETPRFATRLPKPIASASLVDAGRRHPFLLVLDTVSIDAVHLEVSVLWRGSLPLVREDWSDLEVEADIDLGQADDLDGIDAPPFPVRVERGSARPPLVVAPPPIAPPPISLGRGLRLNDASAKAPAGSLVSAGSLATPRPPDVVESALFEGSMNGPQTLRATPPPVVAPPRVVAPPPATGTAPRATTGTEPPPAMAAAGSEPFPGQPSVPQPPRVPSLAQPPAPGPLMGMGFAGALGTNVGGSSALGRLQSAPVAPASDARDQGGAPGTMPPPGDVAPPIVPVPPPAPRPVASPAPAVAEPPLAVAVAVSEPAAPSPSLSATGSVPKATDPDATGIRGVVISRVAAKQSLSDLNLTGADLSNIDLSDVVLSGLNFTGGRLVGATLRRARLSNAKLAGADLTGADLSDADLTQADLSRATLVDANFERAQLLDANLSGGDGKGAKFAKVRAQRAIFAQGKWSGASFVEADLAGADLSGSELSNAQLDAASLTNARFVDVRASGLRAPGARLADANLAGASFNDCDFTEVDAQRTVWDRAVLDGSTFKGAKLDAAGFARAHLHRAQFVGAVLTKASLMGVTGEAASFAEANLEGVDLRQGKLVDGDFQKAKLCRINALKATFTGAVMTGADLTGASLRSAKLRSVNLAGAVLKDADLRDADLEQADLRGAEKQGAKLAGASLKGAMEGE